MRIKKNDKVVVIRGKNRGKTGKVLVAFPNLAKVIVEGVNIHKKHVRPRKQGEKGQIIEMPMSIFVSNVKLICPKCRLATRVGHKVEAKDKYRICKKCGEAVN